MTDFVELPEAYSGLIYCNVLCGIIRGALEMVSSSLTRVCAAPLAQVVCLTAWAALVFAAAASQSGPFSKEGYV